MDTKLLTHLILLLVVTASSPASASLKNFRILNMRFEVKVTASCSVSADGMSARLKVNGLKPKHIRQVKTERKEGIYHVSFAHHMGSLLVGTIDGKGLVRCKVLSGGKSLRVVIGTMDRRQYLKDIRRSVLKPYPKPVDTSTKAIMVGVVKLMKTGKYTEALQGLEKLHKHALLRDWVKLRKADLHFIEGRVPTAFVKYKIMSEGAETQGMQLVALARASELAWVVDGKAPPKELVKVLMQPSTPLGDYARKRLINVLSISGDLDRALALSRHNPLPGAREANNALLLALTRRLLRQGKSYDAALAYLRTRAKLHPSYLMTGVLINAGRAYLNLDLPADAAKVLQKALGATKVHSKRDKVLPMLMEAFMQSKQAYRARQTADFYIARYPKNGTRVGDMIEARVRLRLAEGDLKGAAADLARLAPGRAMKLRKLLALKQGKAEQLLKSRAKAWQGLSQLQERQERIRKQVETKK